MILKIQNCPAQLTSNVLIKQFKSMYGLELLDRMKALDLPLKEGTIYPLLNRLTEDKLLQSTWQTENVKGHPRKFYSLTALGLQAVADMEGEFTKMIDLITQIKQQESPNE